MINAYKAGQDIAALRKTTVILRIVASFKIALDSEGVTIDLANEVLKLTLTRKVSSRGKEMHARIVDIEEAKRYKSTRLSSGIIYDPDAEDKGLDAPDLLEGKGGDEEVGELGIIADEGLDESSAGVGKGLGELDLEDGKGLGRLDLEDGKVLGEPAD